MKQSIRRSPSLNINTNRSLRPASHTQSTLSTFRVTNLSSQTSSSRSHGQIASLNKSSVPSLSSSINSIASNKTRTHHSSRMRSIHTRNSIHQSLQQAKHAHLTTTTTTTHTDTPYMQISRAFALFSFRDKIPQIEHTSYISKASTVIGDVHIGMF